LQSFTFGGDHPDPLKMVKQKMSVCVFAVALLIVGILYFYRLTGTFICEQKVQWSS